MPRDDWLKKDILVAVSGLTPQVITETLYYLTQRKKPSINISEIYALTTEPGKKLILSKLLDRKYGAFYSFCREYGIKSSQIKFDNSTIKLFKDNNGKSLSDIKTPKENIAVANGITQFIRELSSRPHTRLHCSIAGGRKTMSLYLGYALQLFGRPDDVLYHILVTPAFESHPDFFYKPKKNKTFTYKDRGGKVRKINTSNAKVEMAEIPYVRLREKITSIFGKEELSYTEMVSSAQREIDSAPLLPELVLKRKEREIRIGNRTSRLQPLEMIILLYFAKNKLERCKALKAKSCDGCTRCFENVIECTSSSAVKTMLGDYQKLLSEKSGLYQRLYSSWSEEGISQGRMRENISKINRVIKGIHNSHLYLISSIRVYGDTRYGMKLDRKKIKLF